MQSHREHPGHETPCASTSRPCWSGRASRRHLQEVRDGRCNVIATLRGSGSGPVLMYNGHTDTVPPGEMPDAFSPRVVDGKLTGRGSVDMKGGIAGQLAAMIALKRAGIRLKGDLVFTGVIAEEDSTSLGSLHVIEHGPKRGHGGRVRAYRHGDRHGAQGVRLLSHRHRGAGLPLEQAACRHQRGLQGGAHRQCDRERSLLPVPAPARTPCWAPRRSTWRPCSATPTAKPSRRCAAPLATSRPAPSCRTSAPSTWTGGAFPARSWRT